MTLEDWDSLRKRQPYRYPSVPRAEAENSILWEKSQEEVPIVKEIGAVGMKTVNLRVLRCQRTGFAAVLREQG